MIAFHMLLDLRTSFDGFADRAVAGERFRRVVRDLFYLGHAIAHGNGEASTAHLGDIRRVIADVSDSRIGGACFSKGKLLAPGMASLKVSGAKVGRGGREFEQRQDAKIPQTVFKREQL